MYQERQKGRYIMKTNLNIGKWGNSLAVRLPVELSKLLNISDGDILVAFTTEDNKVVLQKELSRAEKFKQLSQFNAQIDNYNFDRNEIYAERGEKK